MNLIAILFYILAAVMILATLLAITERHPVHAIVYLVTSFFALAAIFYLLAAPLVAMFEVIIYAGAVMVLFMFVIMMLDLGHPDEAKRPSLLIWVLPLLLTAVILSSVVSAATLRSLQGGTGVEIGIREFAAALFGSYGVAVEIISMQLLFAVVGALYLGRRRGGE